MKYKTRSRLTVLRTQPHKLKLTGGEDPHIRIKFVMIFADADDDLIDIQKPM